MGGRCTPETMPIKTASDIPSEARLVCEWRLRNTICFKFVDGMNLPMLDELGALDVIPHSREGEFYCADNIVAEPGWGPFLVDVAMEWVTERSGWLYPHRQAVSSLAKPMWGVYFDPSKRPDIERLPMSKDVENALRIMHTEPELRCLYRKQLSLLAQIRALGKWEDLTPNGYHPFV